MTFLLSPFGERLITGFESFRDHVYKDEGGRETIAWGHLVGPGEVFVQPISVTAAMALFRRDVRRFVSAVNDVVEHPLTQRQFDALVSLCFNIGDGSFARSHLVKRLNAGDIGGVTRDGHSVTYSGAMREWSEFRLVRDLETGEERVSPNLVRRRAREIDVFMADVTGDAGAA